MKDLFYLAKIFASHMDNDDFASAATFLDSSCDYVTEDKVFKGPTEIMGSYKEHSEFAKSTFESVVYESHVEKIDEFNFLATYTDIITINGHKHIYKCQQKLKFNEMGHIVKIVHQDIPGEYENLTSFYRTVGLN